MAKVVAVVAEVIPTCIDFDDTLADNTILGSQVDKHFIPQLSETISRYAAQKRSERVRILVNHDSLERADMVS